jgi:signal recognition particle subunit SRP54
VERDHRSPLRSQSGERLAQLLVGQRRVEGDALVCELLLREPPPRAHEVDRAVDGDADEPGLERSPRVEPVEGGRGLEEGVLCGVVRELAFTARRVRGPPDARPVPVEEASECVAGAAACGKDEVCVALHPPRVRSSLAAAIPSGNRPPVHWRPVFDALADKLQAALGDLRGRGTLDDETISRAMREVRLALLEADVNFEVVKQFVAQVRERALGADVQKSLTPGQQVVKIVHEELTELMGSGSSQIAFSQRPPTTILLAGLQGSGKTTTAGKLALLLKGEGRKPALVAADLQRPAAIDQLVQLGAQVDVPVYADERRDPVKAVRDGIERARTDGRDVVILDTAGRLQIDEPLMEELAAVRREAKPTNVLLVLDAMTGQEAVNVAKAFQERIDFDGVVMTKLDGDARGGAALSVKAITGKPIKLASVGEKLDALEWFHPDRMAGRILGMGDVLTLIERAEAAVAEDEKEDLERRLMAGEFSFDDFLKSYKMLRRMGPLQGVLKMIPGLGKQLEGLDQVDDRQLAQVEAVILSMTPHERRVPHVIDGSRRKRIAAGSGTTVEQVNQLLEGRKQMAKMMKAMGSGKLPALPGSSGTMPQAPSGKPRPSATRKSGSKRKKKKAKR